MTDDPRALHVQRTPTADTVARMLGVATIHVGVIVPPDEHGDGRVDVNLDGQLTRLSIVLDPDAQAPPPPTVVRALERRKQRARERRKQRARADAAALIARAEFELAEEAWERRAVAAHHDALDRMAGRQIEATIAATGCRPAWLVAAEAVDRARQPLTAAARQQPPVLTATTAAALGLSAQRPPSRLESCRMCGERSHGSYLCGECREVVR